jgi:uncharacterized protein
VPVTPTYPGVYIEEVPSGVRTITGVATSITAFIGRTYKGPVNEPIRVQNFGEFLRTFGGLWTLSPLSYAIQQYFLNGGADAIVVRVHNGATEATIDLGAGGDTLGLEANGAGTWGNNLRATVDHDIADPTDDAYFNLTIEEIEPNAEVPSTTEVFRNVTVDPEATRFITKVLETQSGLVRVAGDAPADRPETTVNQVSNADGTDGDPIEDDNISHVNLSGNKEGLWALEKADLFNILCIPPLTRDTDIGKATRDAAAAFCRARRAMYVMDAPSEWNDAGDAAGNLDDLRTGNDENVAVYFPRMKAPDAQNENRLEDFAPSGAVAGLYARTDVQRGVWKAPAGQDAVVAGAQELSVKLTDGEQGLLNQIGLNCLRTFPVIGSVVWGARTLRGADRLASEWKYVPIRRLALFIEETLYRGTHWVVFEPNDEPLWSQIRLNVGAFMQSLFRQGAFQGSSPRDAYFVKCDAETTTQTDRNNGIVNILVGFAPLKPAEFVIIKISQIAGQIET